jgi:hypothetical protein
LGGEPSAEWAALLECVLPQVDVLRLRELFRRVSWPALVRLAEDHSVIALLAGAVRRVEEVGAAEPSVVPADAAQQIRELHRAQVLSTLKMTAELFRLVDLARGARLDSVLLKGPTLALRAYGDTGARHYGDLDFLVRQKDILRATELMISAGYRPEIPAEAIRAEKIPGQYLFVRTAAPLLIEFHTERTMRYFPRGLPIEDFFARRQHVRIDDHEIPALSLEDELVLICIHGAKHLWERLTLVADVAGYVSRQSGLDWERGFATARSIGAECMLNTGLLLARNLLETPVPRGIGQRVEADAAAVHLAEQIAGWLPAAGQQLPGLFARALFRMRMRGSAASGLGYLLRLTFSPTQEDWSGADGRTSGAGFASLRRPMRLAKKYRSGGKER